jgi:NADH dehydrogenase FAD-containing subunit
MSTPSVGTATGTVSPNSIIEPIRWYISSKFNSPSTTAIPLKASGEKENMIVRTPDSSQQSSFFVNAECTNIDIKNKRVLCRDIVVTPPSVVSGTGLNGKPKAEDELSIDYDYLVVAVGAEPNTFNIPGVKEVCSIKY